MNETYCVLPLLPKGHLAPSPLHTHFLRVPASAAIIFNEYDSGTLFIAGEQLLNLKFKIIPRVLCWDVACTWQFTPFACSDTTMRSLPSVNRLCVSTSLQRKATGPAKLGARGGSSGGSSQSTSLAVVNVDSRHAYQAHFHSRGGFNALKSFVCESSQTLFLAF